MSALVCVLCGRNFNTQRAGQRHTPSSLASLKMLTYLSPYVKNLGIARTFGIEVFSEAPCGDIAEATVGADMIVKPAPIFDQHARFGQSP